MILLEYHNIWQLCACNDIIHGAFEIDTKFHSVSCITFWWKYYTSKIIHFIWRLCLPSKLTAGCMLYWYSQCLSFICWHCLKFRNELYENNVWRWDIIEVGFKMTCTCCFHIVCTGLKQKSLLAHHYEWKTSRILFHAICIAHEFYIFLW